MLGLLKFMNDSHYLKDNELNNLQLSISNRILERGKEIKYSQFIIYITIFEYFNIVQI